MTLVVTVAIVLVLTGLAFVLKNAILHMVCVPAWIVLGILLWNQASGADNAYVPTALILLAISMVIVNLITTVNHYLGQRTAPPTHDEVQARYKKRVRDITHRERDWPWP